MHYWPNTAGPHVYIGMTEGIFFLGGGGVEVLVPGVQ